MDALFALIAGLIPIIGIVLFALVGAYVIYLLVKGRYKAADANQVLVISGGRKGLKTRVAGGAFVSPLHKVQYFSLETMTVQSDDQETHSSTIVPVIVKWTAQLRADTETPGALDKAIQGFISYKDDAAIAHSLKQTLDGEVRAVIATMTPEAVVREKEHFSTQVTTGVQERMTELGFKLVSLNIAEVSDRGEHYNNLATEDREARRLSAQKLTAAADKDIAVAQAEADQVAQAARLTRDLAVAEETRKVTLRTAAIQAETDQAQTDAKYAGQLRAQDRDKELAASKGEVKVIEVQQEQAAAEARRKVELTDAETRKQREAVEAEAAKQQSEIAASAEARNSEIAAEAQATVAKRKATGEAEAAAIKAKGEAEAINKTTEAKADQVRKTGLAEAEVTRAQGEAEAAAIKAKGEAEAEVQRRMAEALAANDGANLQVTLAEIQRDTTVKVYTTVGEAMARIGEHATFIDMGGSSSSDGDLFSKVLGNVPEMLKKLDVKSGALSGLTFGDSVGSLISSITNGGAPQETAEVPAIETTPSVEKNTTDPVEFSENGQEPAQV